MSKCDDGNLGEGGRHNETNNMIAAGIWTGFTFAVVVKVPAVPGFAIDPWRITSIVSRGVSLLPLLHILLMCHFGPGRYAAGWLSSSCGCLVHGGSLYLDTWPIAIAALYVADSLLRIFPLRLQRLGPGLPNVRKRA